MQQWPTNELCTCRVTGAREAQEAGKLLANLEAVSKGKLYGNSIREFRAADGARLPYHRFQKVRRCTFL